MEKRGHCWQEGKGRDPGGKSARGPRDPGQQRNQGSSENTDSRSRQRRARASGKQVSDLGRSHTGTPSSHEGDPGTGPAAARTNPDNTLSKRTQPRPRVT